ncbi:MAG: chemotaxis protein CheW [Alphaproteobacteria bacterium]|nr:MAG: chemotaxis protein CheW [Alphaproteobacteria bacterium]
MDDMLGEFLTETNENLARLDTELVKLERTPNDPALLSDIFRIIHTIKGTCGFVGLTRLEAVAHSTENVLGKFRDGLLPVTPDAVTLILESFDCVKNILAFLEATESEPEGSDSDLIGRLNALAEGKKPAPAAVVESAPKAVIPAKEETAKEETAAVAKPAAPMSESVIEDEDGGDEMSGTSVVAPHAAAKQNDKEPALPQESAVSGQSIRVSVNLLEALMTTVSELVLTRNQLLQIMRNQKDSDFAAPLQRLNLITSEIQEGVMKTRMQPIGNAWAKLPRLVRDLSVELGKKIDLQMRGAETELDRQVLEMIKDPLTHMVRNAADHGLESAAERAKAGKSDTGHIQLNAYHEGGHIIIEVGDDGRGLNLDRIKTKIVTNGLASEQDLSAMTPQQIYQFVFRPGFSTAEKVTNLSGRGVGMDVVKTNIEKIGGTVDLSSTPGRGSRFMIKIPLTLAIVSALIVECASERFAIPQICVIELVRASAQSDQRIERIHDTPVLRLRNRLLPLVSLRSLLKLGDSKTGSDKESFVVVTQIGTVTFGIMVDRVFDTEEIVVKPVAPILRHIGLFSGNTILGDGSVIMILDPNGIASAVGEIQISNDTADMENKARASRSDGATSLLLFRAGDSAPKAVPLALVARLEDIDMATVELSNGKPVVQYRENLMPLVPIDPCYDMPREGHRPVLVFSDQEHSMGLVVDEIIDIVETHMAAQLSGDRPGFLGSAIIAGHATDIIDTVYFLTQAFHDWFGTAEDGDRGRTKIRGQRVLLVDDSPFFRNLLSPLLNVSGYQVTAVESAEEALGLRESGEVFDAIVSDIEMPGMNGFDFARAVRGDETWHKVPLLALSSHASEEARSEGREAGFDDYVAKFDRDAVLESLARVVKSHAGEGRKA